MRWIVVEFEHGRGRGVGDRLEHSRGHELGVGQRSVVINFGVGVGD